MLPRFPIPIGFCIVANTGEGKAEADGTNVGEIIEDAYVANIGKLGSTVKGIVEDAVPDVPDTFDLDIS